MKKFYKSAMYLMLLVAAVVAGLIGWVVTLLADGDDRGIFYFLARDAKEGAPFMFGILLLIGVANFLGSRFTLGPKWDFVTGSLPVFMLLPGMLVCVVTIIVAVKVGSDSPYIMHILYGGIGLILTILAGGSALRGMADDDRIMREIASGQRG